MHHRHLTTGFERIHIGLQRTNVRGVHFKQFEFVLFPQQMVGNHGRAGVIEQAALLVKVVQHLAVIHQGLGHGTRQLGFVAHQCQQTFVRLAALPRICAVQAVHACTGMGIDGGEPYIFEC